MNIAAIMTATTNKIAPLSLYPSIAWPKPGMKNEKIPLVTASLSTKIKHFNISLYNNLGFPKYIIFEKTVYSIQIVIFHSDFCEKYVIYF